MNQIGNKFLLPGDKAMTKTQRQPGFTCSACRPFTKNNKRIKKVKKQEVQQIFIKMT